MTHHLNAKPCAMTLHSSAKPCAICSDAIYWSGIGAVVYAPAETDLYAIAVTIHRIRPWYCHAARCSAAGRRAETVRGRFEIARAREVHAGFWRP